MDEYHRRLCGRDKMERDRREVGGKETMVTREER